MVRTVGQERFDAVHMACHGELDPVNPVFSSLLLAPGEGEDGDLTVEEAQGLNMQGALLTLSACQTALSPVSRGDKVVGLTRAFLYAGASSVVSSLWEVNDQATSLLRGLFYEGLRSLPAPAALARAQAEMHRRGFSPY